MTKALPHANFHSSTLIRCLIDLNIVDSLESEGAFAEKLGLWVHFADAINLSAVHHDNAAMSLTIPSQTPLSLSAAIVVEFDRIQKELADSINASCSPRPGKSPIQLPIPALELPMDLSAAYAPYRWFYDAHQRDMELRIPPLRANVRNTLVNVSPRLKQLAKLDAALESILRERESKLLAKIPVLLKKRFEQLFQAHQHRQSNSGQADNPARWTQPTGWLAHFCSDINTLLLAELELRLQPTMGLIEALDHKIHNE